MAGPLSIPDYRQRAEFRIGDVLIRSWQTLWRRFPTFLLLTGGVMLPRLLPLNGIVPPGNAQSLVSFLLRLVLGTLVDAIVIFAVFDDLRGRKGNAVESIARGLARFLPAICVSLILGPLFLIGFLLLIVPGLIAGGMLAVAVPVCVVERAGTGKSLSRSADLTRGYRRPIIAVLTAYFIVELVVAFTIRGAVPAGWPAVIVRWLWSVITTAYFAVYHAILYHDLRLLKEGAGVEDIAAVFD